MRKTLAIFTIAAVLIPTVSFAQTTADRDALVQQLIAALMQQIQLLQEKLEKLQDAEAVAERVYEEKKAEEKAQEQAEADAVAKEEAAKKAAEDAEQQKKLEAIERDGYYIECFDSGRCVKWTSGMCWHEQLPGGNYSQRRSCGG